MKTRYKIAGIIVLIAAIAVYYYVRIPAINYHSPGLWTFFIVLLLAVTIIFALAKRVQTISEAKNYKFIRIGIILALIVVLIFLVGQIVSSPLVNADKYQNLLNIETRNMTEDIKETDFKNVPLLDKDSASLLGNRKMGSIVDYVSQFEVSDLYSQINYKGKPYRVTPLVYASPIKWLTNQSEGIPAYIMIDMATQETTLQKLDNPIRYSESEYFNRNIYRHLRFQYPTYLFDQLSFEIDDTGVPYWICPIKQYEIGLFGGQTIGGVVLCNASTGECTEYSLSDCPQWVDRACPADLLIELYNYHGNLVNGFINSIFGQKGCLQTTDGFNYLAMNDDVWVYTGITSVSGDKSNVGFVLMNQRTTETRYYEISGAEEHSAMESAEGQVQNLGYTATFPLLVNVSGEPTYFLGLKDSAGLVKKYAMVNIQKYQNVAIGDTVEACQKQYILMLKQNGVTDSTKNSSITQSITGTIKRIAQSVIDGNSHFYVTLDQSADVFEFPITDFKEIIAYNTGDSITIDYVKTDSTITVLGIKAA